MWWKKKKHPPFVPGGYVPTGFPWAGPIPNRGGEIIPDRIETEPVRGYRYWLLAADPDGIALKSLHTDLVWQTSNTAECRRGMVGTVEHDGISPHPDCSCGFYAENPDHPLNEWQTRTQAVASASGSILMSGRIVVCTHGYKAQHVAIESPVVVAAECQGSCGVRPTRIELPRPGGQYAAWCDTHAPERWNYDRVTVDADVWLRHAVEELSERYEDVEFITDALL